MSTEVDVVEHDDEENIEDVYLTFKVSREPYAVGVVHVTEIVRIQEINRMPGMSAAFRGVINLRGHVVPVLDMQARFGLPPIEPNDRTVIVVLEMGEERAGLMVEEVTEVVELAGKDIEPASTSVGAERAKRSLVKGIAKRGDKVCMVLDVSRLLGQGSAMSEQRAESVSVAEA